MSLLDAQTSSHTECQLKFTCSQASLEPIRGLLGPIVSTLPTLGLSHFPEVAPQADACAGTRSGPPGPRGVLPPPTLVSTPLFPGMCYVWGLVLSAPPQRGAVACEPVSEAGATRPRWQVRVRVRPTFHLPTACGGPLCRMLGKEAAGNQTPVSLWLWLGGPPKPSGFAAPTTAGFSVKVRRLLRPW